MISWAGIDFQNNVVTLCILIIVFVVSVKIVSRLKSSDEPKPVDLSGNDTVFTGRCKFPDCVRCRRNKDVLMRARTRLTYCDSHHQAGDNATVAAHLLKDIQASYQKLTLDMVAEGPSNNVEETKQNPLIFHMKGIRAQPVWDTDDFAGVDLLSDKWEEIQREFDDLLGSYGQSSECDYWKVNETPSGRWGLCHLVDQGVQTGAVAACPVTWHTVRSLPSAMTDTLFGNVAFSVIEPGTTIAPHFGPTNIRIRCHLGLRTPPGCQLTVADRWLQWRRGKLLCFDETFLHGVGPIEELPAPCRGENPSRGEKRAVLIVDLWHPDVSSEQRTLLSYAFSSSAVS